mmetsp:Transcript_11851/g.37650  ORF Transcript_11851/g.37650 Transcript_11851/m.37650 type:complete len:219 (-) Transcript_11851:1192-1848(-)
MASLRATDASSSSNTVETGGLPASIDSMVSTACSDRPSRRCCSTRCRRPALCPAVMATSCRSSAGASQYADTSSALRSASGCTQRSVTSVFVWLASSSSASASARKVTILSARRVCTRGSAEPTRTRHRCPADPSHRVSCSRSSSTRRTARSATIAPMWRPGMSSAGGWMPPQMRERDVSSAASLYRAHCREKVREGPRSNSRKSSRSAVYWPMPPGK